MKNATSFFDSQPMMVVSRQSGKILDVNEAAIQWYGYSRNDLLSKGVDDLGDKLGRTNGDDQVHSSNSQGHIYHHQKENGTEAVVQLSYHELHSNDVPAWLVVVHEAPNGGGNGIQEAVSKQISEDKQDIYKEMFSILSEEALVGIYLLQDNLYKYVNQQFANIFGYQKEEVQNSLSPADIIYASDQGEMNEQINARLEGNVDSARLEFRGLTRDGQVIYLQAYGVATIYQGKPAIAGTLLDVSDDQQALKRYQSSIKSYEDLFDSISDSIFVIDKGYHILEVNQSAINESRYSRNYLIGNTPDKLLASSSLNLRSLIKRFKKAYEGETQRFEQWGQRKGGEKSLQEIVLTSANFFGRKVIIAMARDITKRHESQRHLRKSEERFRQLFQNAPVPITMMDKELSVTRTNQAFTKLFGYDEKQIGHKNIDNLLAPPGEHPKAIEMSRKLAKGETVQSDGKRKNKNGELLDVLIYGLPVSINQALIATFGIYIDITEQKRAEEHAQKSLKEKNVLLAEIHHRVKNNLAVIIGLLELQARTAESEEASKILQESRMRVNSIALIHEKLYQTDRFSEIWFDEYLKELTDVIVESLQTSQTKIDIGTYADEVELTIRQAIPCGLILNELITNAYQHAFGGRDQGSVDIYLTQKEGQVTMKITDNGVGLPDDFSGMDQPKTLGLKLIQTLTRQLKGQSDIHNTEKGTEFVLTFQPKN